MKAWIDGGFVPWEEATVPILSHGFSRGTAIFEVLDVAETPRGPAVFRLDAHVERFFNSASLLRMELPLGKDELARAVVETVRENGGTSGAVKFFAYFNRVAFELVPEDPGVQVAVFFIPPKRAGEDRKRAGAPVTAGIPTLRKVSPGAVPVHAKATGHYVGPYLAKLEVREKGCDEVILLDETGHVAEGALCNAFFVSGGVVRTPRLRNALPGITRDSVLELIRGLEIPFEEADITPGEVLASDEIFFTGSTIRVLPVSAVDGRTVGAECPGPRTRNIRKALDDAYEGRDPRYEKWLTYVSVGSR